MRTTKALIEEIRGILDENNEANIDDRRDILPALNRAYDKAVNIISRHYVDALVKKRMVTVAERGEDDLWDIPADAFEERLLKAEVRVGNIYHELKRVDYTDVTELETPGVVSAPYYYTIEGRKWRTLPKASGAYPFRIWTATTPGPLQMEQGRVASFNSTAGFLLLDELDPDLSTESASLRSYINVVDGATGAIKGTHQVAQVLGNRLTIRSVPSRDSVFGRVVTGTLPLNLAKDDYICSAQGTVIPVLQHTLSTYLVEYAVLDMQRKLAEDPQLGKMLESELANNLEKMSFGREPDKRVKKRNGQWTPIYRRVLQRG